MQLIDPNGDVRLGYFSQPVEIINHSDYDLWTPLDRPASWFQRQLGFNQFEFIGMLSDELVIGAAISCVGYITVAFAYVLDRQSGQQVTVQQKLPLRLGARLVQTPESGISEFVGFGLKVEMSTLGNARRLRVRSRQLTLDATISEGQRAPLRLCTRAGETGWTFTRKTAGHDVTGTACFNGQTRSLETLRGLHDWSAGFMRRETFWNWAAAAGTLRDGRLLGLNLSCGVNETSFSENTLWVDETRHQLPQVHFHYNRRDLDAPWTISDAKDQVSLSFQPAITAHEESINAIIVASNFRQIFGHYTGQISLDDGTMIHLDQVPGFAERHFARW